MRKQKSKNKKEKKVTQEELENKTEETEIKKEEKNKLTISEEGFLKAETVEAKYRFCELILNSHMAPRGYKNPMQVLVAMEFAGQLGVSPLLALNNIAVINDSPALWGELPMAVCINTGQVEESELFLFDKDYQKICFANKNLHEQVFGAFFRIKRRGFEEIESTYTVDEARQAGLMTRDPWIKYTKIMLLRRARSLALKLAFPDALLGVKIAEYDFHELPDFNTKDVTTDQSVENFKKLMT